MFGVEELDQCTKSLFVRLQQRSVMLRSVRFAHQGLVEIAFYVYRCEPFVTEIWSTVKIDGSNNRHIGCQRSDVSIGIQRNTSLKYIASTFGRSMGLGF